MALTAGTRLGVYEILTTIGAGGMGEVYRARDTRLNRDVAIKVLPDAFAFDTERLARFTREAQTLASLNHSNIAAIYGLEEGPTRVSPAESGPHIRALVMEFVEGEDLSQRIARGAIPLDEALPIARQIAEALEAAHEQGIIHRDLKPANIKVRSDGTVKVLDFGLAKAMEAGGAGQAGGAGRESLTMSPTITSPAMTQAGIILGTAAYMAPEQARGKSVDKRADIWAFGVVLCEMLTGRRAFDGDDLSITLAFVMTKDPDWAALPSATPPALQRLLRRCLEKEPRRRLRDIGEARLALTDGFGAESPASTASQPPPVQSLGRRLALVGVLALAIGAALAGVGMWFATRPTTPPIARFMVAPTGTAAMTQITLDRELAVGPDGRHIVYVGNNGTQLFVRAMDQLEPTAIAGLNFPRGPFVSPDEKWIGFFDGAGQSAAERGTTITLKKVSISGGPALPICGITGGDRGGATWGDDDTIVFGMTDAASGLWRVPAGGGKPAQLTTPNHERGEADHLWPEFLPGGQAVLFTITSTAGGIESAQVAVLDLKTGTQKILVPGGSHAHYVASGHLVYGVDGTLRAVRFDLKRLETTGSPVPVLPKVVTTSAGAADFDVARDGTLVYVPGATASGLQAPAPARTLVWVDRQGHEEAIKAQARAYVSPRISPDGTRIAVDILDQQDDIWIWNVVGETLTRLTFDPGLDQAPVWMPDGHRLVFSSEFGGANRSLAWQAADGTGNPERLSQGSAPQFPSSVDRDGAHVVFTLGGGAPDITMLSMDKERKEQSLVKTPLAERNAVVSPDGRWLAYEAFDSGQAEIYVRPFPDVNGGHYQVSGGGGTAPAWASSGQEQELFFQGPTGALMSVRVQPGNAWKPSAPTKILDGRYILAARGNQRRAYDVSSDGRRFLMVKPAPSELINQPAAPVQSTVPTRRSEEGLVVVQHWDEELKRLVPAK